MLRLILVSIVCFYSLLGAFNPREYPNKRLADVVDNLFQSDCSDHLKRSYTLIPKTVPFSSEVYYTGLIRRISRENKELLKAYYGAFGMKGLEKYYRYEVEVKDGAVNLWLPIQTRALAEFKKYFTSKDMVFLVYARVLGCYYLEMGTKLNNLVLVAPIMNFGTYKN